MEKAESDGFTLIMETFGYCKVLHTLSESVRMMLWT